MATKASKATMVNKATKVNKANQDSDSYSLIVTFKTINRQFHPWFKTNTFPNKNKNNNKSKNNQIISIDFVKTFLKTNFRFDSLETCLTLILFRFTVEHFLPTGLKWSKFVSFKNNLRCVYMFFTMIFCFFVISGLCCCITQYWNILSYLHIKWSKMDHSNAVTFVFLVFSRFFGTCQGQNEVVLR